MPVWFESFDCVHLHQSGWYFYSAFKAWKLQFLFIVCIQKTCKVFRSPPLVLRNVIWFWKEYTITELSFWGELLFQLYWFTNLKWLKVHRTQHTVLIFPGYSSDPKIWSRFCNNPQKEVVRCGRSYSQVYSHLNIILK